jgi:hypothetical protein
MPLRGVQRTPLRVIAALFAELASEPWGLPRHPRMPV